MRDLVGYGPTTPLPRWPDGSLVAVNVVVNVEEGAEASWEDGEGNDGWGEYALPIDPAVRDLGTEGHYAFGARVGIWRLVRLFERFDVPVTFGVCARALERNPPFAAWLRASDHDVLGHGYRWAEVTAMTEDEERADLEHAMRVLPELVGRPVRGWYVRSFPSERTRRLAATHPDLRYDSDAVDDELPYRTEVDGRPWLVVPYSKVHNDTRYFLPPTYATPRHFAESLTGAVEFLLDEARHGAGARMMTVGLHPRWSGQAARAVAVRDFLAHVTTLPEVAFVHRQQVVDWWDEHVPG
ncbi:polysaccharide deacetylase family protein [Actinomycetospora termitidis]|uniref:Polysaccharide deacetylase family protein n=1 Tax=Actinomycetospora termitidis TaxID=3053470 RepID=A0ABT7M3X3_9PSEU|nr:polysaccharide deacetylase family protein [Actinomycetospora sp. Odt1-22]MDL5155373.1 polysaccharide deacetylase family protein [Actinomycetospora sp. Odt1-22]